MIVEGQQRWRDGRPCFPGRAVMATGSLEVAVLADDTTPKAFVTRHHYSRTYPAARARLGLYRRGELIGTAVFSVPVTGAVLDVLPCPRDAAVELGRFVLLDAAAANAESWFLARAFDELRRLGFAGVVSFSDPQPRLTAAGDLVMGGHVGTIYQATSAVHMAFVQLSLLGVPGVVVVGDTLRMEYRAAWYTPAHILGGWGRKPRGGRDILGELPALVAAAAKLEAPANEPPPVISAEPAPSPAAGQLAMPWGGRAA